MSEQTEYITPSVAIKYLDLSPSSLYRYIQLGILIPDGKGNRGQPLFLKETLDNFQQNRVWKIGTQSQGKSLYLQNAERPLENVVHPNGSTIHWSERYRGGNNLTYVPITCTNCKEKFNKLDNHLMIGLKNGKFTGCCTKCYRFARRSSKLRGNGFIDRDGYVFRHRLTFSPDEWNIIGKMSTNGRDYIMEHRAIVALSLGRPLAPTEVVHHKNGVKNDNRVDNLELVAYNEHARFHGQLITRFNDIETILQTKIAELESRVSQLETLLNQLLNLK